jgi:D-glycero-alpha-D-manno-heptose-7-phosphate kinase
MAGIAMRITAKAPCRVDLAGGTLDIWPLYLNHAGAVTVNAAVSLYTHATIETRPDSRIHLETLDLKGREEFASLAELNAARKYKLKLLAYALRWFQPTTGLNVTTNSEAPAGAGISGSSSLLISLCTALNKLTGRGYSIEKIREVAQNIEAQIIQVPTGCQDYYPAMYGGVSAIELGCDGITRKALPVPGHELESRAVLAYTGEPRNSGINNWEVTKLYIDGDKTVRRNFEKISQIAGNMRGAIEQQNWAEAGRLLREEWSFRRRNAPGISTELIDALAGKSRKAGALGLKVCGAGGGGCVFLLTEPETRDRVAHLVSSLGAQVLNFQIAPKGVSLKTSA